jgi:hypothetical protein
VVISVGSEGGRQRKPFTCSFKGISGTISAGRVRLGECWSSVPNDSALGISVSVPLRICGAGLFAWFSAGDLPLRLSGFPFLSGNLVSVCVPCAPGAVSGRSGIGVPQIRQKRLPAWFAYPQALQITMHRIQTILDDDGAFANPMKVLGRRTLSARPWSPKRQGMHLRR